MSVLVQVKLKQKVWKIDWDSVQNVAKGVRFEAKNEDGEIKTVSIYGNYLQAIEIGRVQGVMFIHSLFSVWQMY